MALLQGTDPSPTASLEETGQRRGLWNPRNGMYIVPRTLVKRVTWGRAKNNGNLGELLLRQTGQGRTGRGWLGEALRVQVMH